MCNSENLFLFSSYNGSGFQNQSTSIKLYIECALESRQLELERTSPQIKIIFHFCQQIYYSVWLLLTYSILLLRAYGAIKLYWCV